MASALSKVFTERDRLTAEAFNAALRPIYAELEAVKARRADYEAQITLFNSEGIKRVAEAIKPLIDQISSAIDGGLLVAKTEDLVAIVDGEEVAFLVPDAARAAFRPTPFLSITAPDVKDDWAIGRTVDYNEVTGFLNLEIIYLHGSGAERSGWTVSASSGIVQAVSQWLDEIEGLHSEVMAKAAEVESDRADVLEFKDAAGASAQLAAESASAAAQHAAFFDVNIGAATQAALNALDTDKLDISALGSTLAAKDAATDGADDFLVIRDGEVQRLALLQPTVMMFNADGNGIADDTPAWVKWHNYHEANGSKYRPIGAGNFKLTTGTTYAVTSDCEIDGAGMGVTTIVHNDATAQNLFSFPNPLNRVAISNLSIRGSHDANRSFLSAYPLYVYNTKDVVIRNVEVSYSRVFGITVRKADRVTITGCHVHHCARDGISAADCSEAIITDNRIHDCDDDAIGVHNQVFGYQRGHVIANNKIRKAQGIKVLGAQGVTITGNTLEFFFSHGITVRTEALNGTAIEGINAAVGVVISGNVLLDGYNRSALDNLNQSQYYITIGSASARAGSLSAIPGVSKTPGFDLPYNYFQNVKTLAENVSTTPIPLSQRMLVQGNIMGRTLKESGNFSDYGFGQFWLRNGEMDIDLSVTAKTRITGVYVASSSAVQGVSVKDNIVFGLGNFMEFEATAMRGSEILVEGNHLHDVKGAFHCVLASTSTQRITWRNNTIDMDPYHREALRQSDGTWSSSGHPTAFLLQGMKGLELYGNRFRNLNRILDRDVGTAHGDGSLIIDGNIVECDPTTIDAYSALNRGVGTIPSVGNTQIVHVECNPNSADFGLVYNALLRELHVIPSTGKYPKGWFVRNRNPSISAGKVLLGWVRLTTGNAHVSGTDWTPVYGTTS